MIVVAPAGGWAARRSRSTPPVSATETATAPIRAGVTPCAYALGSPSRPNAPSAATAARMATKCPITALRTVPTSASGVSKKRNAVAPRLGKRSGSPSSHAQKPLSPIAISEPVAV